MKTDELREKYSKRLAIIKSLYEESIEKDTDNMLDGSSIILEYAVNLLDKENISVEARIFFLSYVTATLPYLYKDNKKEFNNILEVIE